MTAWRSTGHRGDALEDLILLSNDYYKKHKLGRIDKVSTPIKVVDINKEGLITKGFFEKRSTVDFHGMVQGHGIVFDAKETNLKSIPLSNIHEHQIEYMKDITEQGGLAFLIVHFKFCDEFFLLPYETLIYYFNESQKGARKSIPYKHMDSKFRIKRASNGILNYLPLLNVYLDFKKEFKK